MPRFSALITCTTECWVEVDANSEDEARAKIERGDVDNAGLHLDGGLPFSELLNDVEITRESFGRDDE